MVKVSSGLSGEIKEIESSGAVDMHDPDAVLAYAQQHNLSQVTRMILGNSNRYLRCINDGMEVVD